MTALSAGLALVPIALGSSKRGSEVQAPMAIAIFFGLLNVDGSEYDGCAGGVLPLRSAVNRVTCHDI